MRAQMMAVLVLGAGAGACGAARADVVFQDGTMSDSSWVLETVVLGGGAGSVSVSQVPSGNPGFARRVALTTSSTIGDIVYGFSRFGNTNATRYEPATQGAIVSIAWSIDARLAVGPSADGQVNYLGLRQGNVNYIADPGIASASGQWSTNRAAGLLASDFVRLDGLAGSPNFSATGAPIRFGFVVQGTSNGAAVSTLVDYDNWFVQVVVPAPGVGAGMLAGLVLAGRRRRTM